MLFTLAFPFHNVNILPQLLYNCLYENVTLNLLCLHAVLFTITSPVYCLCCLHMLIFHNVIFFTNYCPIYSITMSIAYPQHIFTVLFTISVLNKLTALFTYAFLFTMWIFLHSYCIIVYYTMFTVRLHWIHTVLFTITLPSILNLMFTCPLFFIMWIFFAHYCTILYIQCLHW